MSQSDVSSVSCQASAAARSLQVAFHFRQQVGRLVRVPKLARQAARLTRHWSRQVEMVDSTYGTIVGYTDAPKLRTV